MKQTKSQRLREKMRSDIKYKKQTTFGSVQEARKAEVSKAPVPEQKKQIEITEITASTREDELALSVGFRLLPSRKDWQSIGSPIFCKVSYGPTKPFEAILIAPAKRAAQTFLISK